MCFAFLLIRSDDLPLVLALLQPSAGELGAEHVDAFDRRPLRQKLRGVRAERVCDWPVEMSLATGLVGEGIEDAEGRRADLQGEPHRGGGFLLRHAEARL